MVEDRKGIILYPPISFSFPLPSGSYGQKHYQVQHRFLLYLKREPVKIIHNPVCIDGFLCCKTFLLIPSGNHAKDIKSCSFLGWNIDILIFEQPSVRYITIDTYMTFISIIKFYFTFGIEAFKFLQLLFLVCVELR